MNSEEWESLCDNCGKCCLHKLEDEDTGEIVYTSLACSLLDLSNCRCTRYSERIQLIPDCIDLKRQDFVEFHWLPATCAYRLIHEEKELPDWHPLLSGSVESVHNQGISIRSYAITASEQDDPEDYIIEWQDQ